MNLRRINYNTYIQKKKKYIIQLNVIYIFLNLKLLLFS